VRGEEGEEKRGNWGVRFGTTLSEQTSGEEGVRGDGGGDGKGEGQGREKRMGSMGRGG